MDPGDIAFILAFIVLPTAILVSSIWLFILVRKGIILAPDRQERFEPESLERPAEDVDDAVAITRSTDWASDEVYEPVAATAAAEPAAIATLDLPVVAEDVGSAIQDARVDDPPLEETELTTDIAPDGVIADQAPPPSESMQPAPTFPIFEETAQLPVIELPSPQASSVDDGDAPSTEPVASATVTVDEHDEVVRDIAAATIVLAADETPMARRKPGARLAPRATLGDEQLRPLAPARRASGRNGEASMQSGNRSVDVGGADDE